VLVLPQTGGNSDLELMIGFAMLGGGLAALFAWNRKSLLAAGR
jgi:LPXTG-motif cell wall-anchored protein